AESLPNPAILPMVLRDRGSFISQWAPPGNNENQPRRNEAGEEFFCSFFVPFVSSWWIIRGRKSSMTVSTVMAKNGARALPEAVSERQSERAGVVGRNIDRGGMRATAIPRLFLCGAFDL